MQNLNVDFPKVKSLAYTLYAYFVHIFWVVLTILQH